MRIEPCPPPTESGVAHDIVATVGHEHHILPTIGALIVRDEQSVSG